MRIYFARHGESEANRLHQISNLGLRHGLTLEGRIEAFSLAEYLQAKSVTRIYSSPLLRAIETTVILANWLGVGYEVADALREFDCGVAEGHADEVAWQMWRDLLEAWLVDGRHDRHIEGGESFDDLRARFVPFVEKLIDRYRETDAGLVCVSHGGVYSAMLPLLLGNVDQEMIAEYGLGYASCVVAEPGGSGLVCTEWNGQPIGVSSARA
jgi:broad specificity phosphatase PhoE